MNYHIFDAQDKESFDKMVERENKADRLVLVDTWAGWCAACKSIDSFLMRIACNIFPQHISMLRVNIDTVPEVAAQYQICGLPTLILIRDEKEIDRRSGAMDERTIIKWIDTFLMEEENGKGKDGD